jgi:hypothetical protein
MRRLFALTLGLGLLSASGYADVIDFTPYAGYTTVNMTDVNKAAAQSVGLWRYEMVEDPSSGFSYTNTDVNSAWIVGGDFLSGRLTPCKSLSLGLRVEYLATNTADDTLSVGGQQALDIKESGTLSSFLLGGRYQLPGAEYGLNLSVGAFGGLGYATMMQSFSLIPDNDTMHNLYDGEGFVGDLDLRLDWTIPGVKWLHLDAQGGYRYASLGDLQSNGNAMGGPLDEFFSFAKVGNTSAVDVDFSGLTAQGGLSVTF